MGKMDKTDGLEKAEIKGGAAFAEMTVKDFTEVLASREPVPGGGGTSALVGALGTALGGMTGALTKGKKKYADVEDDIARLIDDARDTRQRLLDLIDADAEAFRPLSEAYGMPPGPEKDTLMEECLVRAAETPLAIMRECARAVDITSELAEKGSILALSDAGCGALFAGAALKGSVLNVYVNTNLMKNRERAAEMEREAETLLAEYYDKAEKTFENVKERIHG